MLQEMRERGMYGDFILLLTLRRGLPAGRQVGRK